MGRIRKKKVKDTTYLYYSVRTRSRKKNGGSGRVKSIDFCLGRKIYSYGDEAIAYFIWSGDIDEVEFIDALIRFLFEDYANQILWTIDPKRKKIRLRSCRDSWFDCRVRWVREYRKLAESFFDITEEIEEAAQWIVGRYRKYLESIAEKREYEEIAQAYRKKGEYELAGLYDDYIWTLDSNAADYWEWHKENLDRFIKNAPRSIRDEIRKKIERRLAKIKPPKAA